MQSAGDSSEEEYEDDLARHDGHTQNAHNRTRSVESGVVPTEGITKVAGPMPKRRRVARACDECRQCRYDQPSNRRRGPGPKYIEALEIKLQRAEKILQSVLPDVNLDDPALAASMPQPNPCIEPEDLPGTPAQQRQSVRQGKPQNVSYCEKDAMLESMVENIGLLDLDDEGYWDFHGHSSGRAFLRKMREQFGDLMGKADNDMPFIKSSSGSQSGNSPVSTAQSPMGSKLPNTNDLPNKRCAMQLCSNALDDACAVLRFVHQPSFYALFDRVYNTPSENLETQDLKFLPLLYAVIALGTLFATAEQSELMTNGFKNAMAQGLVRSPNVRKTRLHRAIPNTFHPIEQETRKRIFWCIRKLDTYVGALLGLPKMLSDDDIDQDQPEEVDDEYITAEEMRPMPSGRPSLMTAFNAHTRLVTILSKTVRYIYPIKSNKSTKNHSYIVSHAKIREIEEDLQMWMESLPEPLRPGGAAPPEFVRVQHLLRMAYAHIEMFLYRPFLHYVSKDVQAKGFDKRSYACAAACVSVSRNIVHLTGEMKRRGLLVGSYWFYMYTTFFAIISLIFYILENPNSATSADILKDAYEGKDTLADLASKSMAADRCSRHLATLFEQLPERLKGAQMNSNPQRKRHAQSQLPKNQSTPEVNMETANITNASRRAKTLPEQNQQGSSHVSFTSIPQPQPNTDATCLGGSHAPYGPNSDNMQRRQRPISAGYPKQLTDRGVPDLSAMMFPSADPFAYPNQPLTTLENGQFVKQETAPDKNISYSASTTSYENMVPQNLGALHLYSTTPGLLRDSFIPQNLSLTETEAQLNVTATQEGDQEWLEPEQSLGEMQGIDLDHLFGEDWGCWMSQGYRQ
ncbi:MAG: hypothetical protein Q9163_004476 [Psora crenata]